MIHHGDAIEVMQGLEPDGIDAIVTDPPYGLEFMGKEWDRLGVAADRRQPGDPTFHPSGAGPFDRAKVRYGYGGKDVGPAMQSWHQRWAEAAYRVAKPSAYLLAFGGTRTVHRMTVALEDAGWIIRDMLVWAYASGFPKSKASLKPAWEPIVMARKPGPLRMLAIDLCRIGTEDVFVAGGGGTFDAGGNKTPLPTGAVNEWRSGRWPANVILTDPIFDGGVEGVVGGGPAGDFTAGRYRREDETDGLYGFGGRYRDDNVYGDSGTYSRFFLVPKSSRADREPILTPDWFEGTGRVSNHPTVKPTELMRHLVRLVTPVGGVVLDPFGGSGTTAIACELEGFQWVLVEKEAEYVRIIEARLNGTQRGLGLSA